MSRSGEESKTLLLSSSSSTSSNGVNGVKKVGPRRESQITAPSARVGKPTTTSAATTAAATNNNAKAPEAKTWEKPVSTASSAAITAVSTKSLASDTNNTSEDNSREGSLEEKLRLSLLECEALRDVANRCQSELVQLRNFADAERTSYEAHIQELSKGTSSEKQTVREDAAVGTQMTPQKVIPQKELHPRTDKENFAMMRNILAASVLDSNNNLKSTAQLIAAAARQVMITDM
jgi:hypothetical protein